MAERNKQIHFWSTILISVIILTLAVIWAVSNHHTQPHHSIPDTDQHEHHYQPAPDSRFSDSNNRGSERPEQPPPITANTNEPNRPRRSLNDVIRAARGWEAVYRDWYGRTAPDFTLTDINGRQHKLSDYRGKDVLIIFWATWCGPCIREIPHLIALRNIVGEDKLAMLAITNEHPERVRKFVARQKINYTVLSEVNPMPIPYSYVDSIPSSFFIDPNGKIKLATSGTLLLPEIKAILQAE